MYFLVFYSCNKTDIALVIAKNTLDEIKSYIIENRLKIVHKDEDSCQSDFEVLNRDFISDFYRKQDLELCSCHVPYFCRIAYDSDGRIDRVLKELKDYIV